MRVSVLKVAVCPHIIIHCVLSSLSTHDLQSLPRKKSNDFIIWDLYPFVGLSQILSLPQAGESQPFSFGFPLGPVDPSKFGANIVYLSVPPPPICAVRPLKTGVLSCSLYLFCLSSTWYRTSTQSRAVAACIKQVKNCQRCSRSGYKLQRNWQSPSPIYL